MNVAALSTDVGKLQLEILELRQQLQDKAMQEHHLLTKVRQLEADLDVRADARPSAAFQATQPPLTSLGPIQTMRVARVSIVPLEGVKHEGKNGTMYELTGPSSIVSICDRMGLSCMGSISPVREIAISVKKRCASTIPPHAKYFGYAYPLAGVGQLADDQVANLDFTNPVHSFVAFGGFVYFDGAGTALQVNAIDNGPGLNFDGPHWLPREALTALRAQGRMQPVIATPLRATGARYFCWMYPGESLGLPAEINEGAFAYDYGGDGSQNRYFRVVPPAQVVFLPCKHMCACKTCSSNVSACPMCHTEIKLRIEVFR